ncbi:MAG: GTP-binding protein, partial [Clostridiales Family XIII bacterium]|nr:GTP-binding protein [Clostridiales Family XIII bacterium]
MKGYTSDKIRNVVLLGHGSSGKTTIAEAALAATGAVSRMGKVEDGNTVSDYEKTEIDKGYSISLSVVPVEYNKHKINLLDAPGFFDFAGEVASAVRAADAAVIVVDASAGVQVGTEKAWNAAKAAGLPRFFLINKTDKENVDVNQVIADLKEKFGTSVATPDDRDALMEAVAETDEELLEKYFDAGELSDDEFTKGLANGISSGDIALIYTASALKQEGITDFLDIILKYAPSPLAHAPYEAENASGEAVSVAADPAGPVAAFVFKSVVNKTTGKISYIKVIRGTVHPGSEILNVNQEKPEKLSSIFFARGKNQSEAPEVAAGDIFAATKLAYTHTGDTLADKANVVKFP